MAGAFMHPTVARWHDIVANRKMDELAEIIHPDAEFRSPVVHTPYRGREALVLALETVIDVFEDFTYHREFMTEDARHATLEFSARVNDRELKGVDMMSFDADGLITHFEVLVRPATGLMALGEEMNKRVGEQMTALKRQGARP